MSGHRVISKATITCPSCEGDDFGFVGAFRIDTDEIYIMLFCRNEGCGINVPLKIDNIIVELFKGIEVPGSKMVN